MSGVVDVGDAVQLTFNTATGTTVAVSWLDPDQNAVVDNVAVPESPPGTGQFPYTFLPTSSGVWTAVFTAAGEIERYYVRAVAAPALPPFAAVGDVAAQFGTLTGDQETLAGWLLRAASKLVRSRFPLVDSQIAEGRIDPEVVALAVTNMVLRVLRNPQGLRAESVGPFSRTYDTTAAAGLLVISEQEAGMFVPAVPAAAIATIGTIRLGAGLSPRNIRSWRW